MATVTTDFKELLLRGLRWDAEDKSLTLESVLKLACRARLSENAGGQTLIAASGNGSSVQFALPQSSSTLTPESVSAACIDLYRRYEFALAKLIAAGDATPTDDEVLAEMLTKLKPVRSFQSDFSCLTR